MGEYEKRILKVAEADIVAGDDGFFVFWPTGNKGAYSPDCLRVIADELDRRNAPWQAQIDEYFRTHSL